MKIVFNDMSELTVQSVVPYKESLKVKTIFAQPSELREIFEDPVKTRRMKVYEMGDLIATYEGYTVFYRTEEYVGEIYGVTVYKPGDTPEEQADILEAAVKLAKMKAQELDDEQATDVRSLYPQWDGNGNDYTAGFKVNYEDVLYKCLQKHTSQSSWNPKDATSLWAKVLIPAPGIVPDWEQPDSTNPYMKGDKVKHKGKTWESVVDSNVWEPGAVGTESLWKEV